nr:MAG TPA: AAA domain protein [Caudoviricetes sp.]
MEGRYILMFEINTGVVKTPLKVIIYGTEGVGKTTLASKFPKPLFIDAENGSGALNVARYPYPTSWQMLMSEVQEFLNNPQGYKTLVIDSIDWAEAKAIEMICAGMKVNGIEDIGWSKGYTYLNEEMGRLLNLLTEVINRGVNVVLIAHMVIRTITKPEETGSYDRYELKLKQAKNGNNCQLVKEWADLILFCNYREFLVADKTTGKKKATGGKERIMYTEHAATWDAKNRFGLPEVLPLDFEPIAHLFSDNYEVKATEQIKEQPAVNTITKTQQAEPAEQPNPEVNNWTTNTDTHLSIDSTWKPTPYTAEEEAIMAELPKALTDLMKSKQVHPSEIQRAVSIKGYFTKDTPIKNYDPEFIQGCLIGAWPAVMELIQTDRDLPF